MGLLTGFLVAIPVGVVAVLMYRRHGSADSGRGNLPWYKRIWYWILDALAPEPQASVPEPVDDVPAELPPMPPPPPAQSNGHRPAEPEQEQPASFGGAQSDLLHSITSMVNKASHGDIRDVRRCIKTLATAADCLGSGVSHLGRRLAEPDKKYGPEIWEPLTRASSQIRSGALHMGQSDSMVSSLLRTTVGELANSPRQAPHDSQLNGPA